MPSSQVRRYCFTVVFVREGEYWIAQALEYDIAAQGSTQENAKRAFEYAFMGQLQLDHKLKREPFSTLAQAPQRYWDIFAAFVEKNHNLVPEIIRTESLVPGMPPAFMVQAFADGNSHLSR
jgi:hypothetical protein